MTNLPTLRQLRYLCAVADHLHFGKAAASCAVSQSTLSAGIQELEAGLGAALVERTKRQVMLTPLGREVATGSRRLLRESEDLVALARSAAAPLSGELYLGVIPTIGPYLLPRALPLLQTRYPKLRLYLREEQSAALLEGLAQGRLDLVLLALPYDIGDLETMSVGRDELVLVCPANHALAGLREVTTAALADTEMLMLEEGHCLREHALRACGRAAWRGREVFQGTSLKTLVTMVASGLGVTLLPGMAVSSEVDKKTGLVTMPIAKTNAARQIALAWRRSSPRVKEFRLFGETFREAGKVILRDRA
jgi:LysR family hydrogen peroxide-inducible transcriptional activator